MEAKGGEIIRIFFGIGGPNATSSFHVIGEIFDRVYSMGDLASPRCIRCRPQLCRQAAQRWVGLKAGAPGRLILVDHAMSRMEKGLVGFIDAMLQEAMPA